MKPRIELCQSKCGMVDCRDVATHTVVDGYGKRLGPYCFGHALRILATVEEMERAAERARARA